MGDELLQRLKPRERRGSKPRCHLLTNGSEKQVAQCLNGLAAPFARVSSGNHWMPHGFEDIKEPELDKAQRLIPDDRVRKQLGKWWLRVSNPNSRTPNFDIATTCTIENKTGLLLIEAKAHDAELNNEVVGKKLKADASADSKANHERIAAAIQSASEGLQDATSLPWHLSRDSHYQMSNRFAWAWKLTELGFPVVLIYLGFLKAEDMRDKGKPFADDSEWEKLVKKHSEPLFPPSVWNHRWNCNGQAFIPLIRSIEQPLDFLGVPR